MRLIKGENLTEKQLQQVKSAYVHRFTAIGEGKYYKDENAWVKDHAFYFTKGDKLSRKHNHCEPHYMAE